MLYCAINIITKYKTLHFFKCEMIAINSKYFCVTFFCVFAIIKYIYIVIVKNHCKNSVYGKINKKKYNIKPMCSVHKYIIISTLLNLTLKETYFMYLRIRTMCRISIGYSLDKI